MRTVLFPRKEQIQCSQLEMCLWLRIISRVEPFPLFNGLSVCLGIPLLFAAGNFLEWGGKTCVRLRMVALEMVQAFRSCQLSKHSCLNVVCAGLEQCKILRPVLLCSWIG